jgi:hypothetical protein
VAIPCKRKPVAFRSKTGAVSFMASSPGCPKSPPSSAQLTIWERFSDAAKECARSEPRMPVVERAQKCVGPRLREQAPAHTPLRKKATSPKGLDLSRYMIPSLTGCEQKAQERAAEFCQRFTYNADEPELAGALCLRRVRRIFATKGCSRG